MRTLLEIQHQLPSWTEQGLTAADVARSRLLFGGNRLTPLAKKPAWRKFLSKFDEPIIKVLLGAAVLSMIVDVFRPPVDSARYVAGGIAIAVATVAVVGTSLRRRGELVPCLLFMTALILFAIGAMTGHPSYDGLAVMVAIILATGVAFLSEYKSDREFEILNARKESVRVTVRRGGSLQTVALEDVVVGDVVILETGDEVPADGRLLKSAELFINQSTITGEAEEVAKSAESLTVMNDGPEHPACLYRGTQVVAGVGKLLVTEVGDETLLGQVARRLSADEDAAGPGTQEGQVRRKLSVSRELTPLQEKLARLADLISKVGYVAAVAIFVALFLRGLFTVDPTAPPASLPRTEVYWPTSVADLMHVSQRVLGYLMYMVIIIVVAVPEGLPMSVTVSLALAMRKMTRANSLVRQLVACETIGSATVICTDKTGTLTQNKMRVVRVVCGEGTFDRDLPTRGRSKPSPAWPSDAKPLDWIVVNAAVNSTAHLESKGKSLLPVGNSTEGALLVWLDEQGLAYDEFRLRFPPIYQLHFSSERKRMTTVTRQESAVVVLAKGAPEWALQQSTHYLDGEGTSQAWTMEARKRVQEQLADAAAHAMRAIAFAHAVLPAGTPVDADSLVARSDDIENRLTYDGFVALRDPLREDAHEALAQCREAGIEVKMITGDNADTARAISREIGLLDRPDALLLNSEEVNALSDEELKGRLPRLRVLARARPLDKLRMVKLLQEQGEVVAVTGDGTNDAPALKQADVGLAMGRTGTDVAKEASKIVLLDDAFSTIVKAVHWGRSLYENIQRFVQFQLTISVSALVIAFLGPFFGVKPPFTILQLLWINVIMDTLASIALCSEPPRPGIMRLPPRRRDQSIVTRSMVVTIATMSAFFVVVMMVLLLGMENGWWLADGSTPRARGFPELTYWQVSVFFSVYVFFQVWNEINSRSLTPEVSGFNRLFRNPTFLAVIGLIVLGQMLIVTFGGEVFEVSALSPFVWLAIAVGTASVLVYAEAVRRIRLAAQLG
jgi:Ca2+-transporting ATPase